MKYFVTGATGFIGNRLVHTLLDHGNEVNVLIRQQGHGNNLDRKGISVFQGDLFDSDVIEQAMKGCRFVFHLAAFANIWSKDKNYAYKINVEGTKNILEISLRNHIEKLVFTSSAAILAPSKDKEEINEDSPLPETYLTDYEKTKRRAEQLCHEFISKGLEIVIVNPPRVFGPGHLNKSNSVTLLIDKYMKGKWRIIPGNGMQIGNYVLVDDVVNGHILALEKGMPGERYIMGGTNISYNDFFALLAKESMKKRVMFHMPISVMMLVSKFELFMADNIGKKPLITPPWVKRYMQNRVLSSKKAEKELGYNITPLPVAIKKTITWLNQNNK